MARVTIYLRNGREFDFESATLRVDTKPDSTGRDVVTNLEYNRKDNGQSLMFIDKREIAAIVRDTRKQDYDN